jgi:poly-gamma-glutamate capsule biosynthesis protein CapA/YwtB (metallophosphatase superfamily)
MYAVGDVAPTRRDPDSFFVHVSKTLNEADIVFCPLEINITDKPTRIPQLGFHIQASPDTAQAMRRAGITIASMAGNHAFDLGMEGYYDTQNALKSAGISFVGVGENLQEARRPLIVEKNGTRIAFLSYCSVLPVGFAATSAKPGCAPMRAYTHYEPYESFQPGNPCRIKTFPDRQDLEALVADVVAVKDEVDVVVLSLHWGLHFSRALIADYQPVIAHAAIDAGVDLVLGHHPHILKGVEVYKGVPIFYSLCNFALDMPLRASDLEHANFAYFRTLNPDWPPIVEGDPYPMPPEARMTITAKIDITDGAIVRVAVLPTWIVETAEPIILKNGDPRFAQVVDYLRDISLSQGLGVTLTIEGDEVAVSPA